MKTALVWVLAMMSGGTQMEIKYSPPMANLADCQRLQQVQTNLAERMSKNWGVGVGVGSYFQSQCVQLNLVIEQK